MIRDRRVIVDDGRVMRLLAGFTTATDSKMLGTHAAADVTQKPCNQHDSGKRNFQRKDAHE